jgi:hypothetical protein
VQTGQVAGVLAIVALAPIASVARADDAPDANADHTASEANLESNAPRQGTTFSVSLGGGLIINNGTSDPVTALSLRLGHVATAADDITLEVTAGTYFREQGNSTLTDSSTSFLLGDQHYLLPALWLHVAAGLNVHRMDNGPTSTTTRVGPTGAFGLGLDLLRRHLFVIGLESFGILAIESGGAVVTSVLGLNVSYY